MNMDVKITNLNKPGCDELPSRILFCSISSIT